MTIYIDINGSWGPADELILIDDSTWETREYDLMSTWNEKTLAAFSETHDGMTPTEWDMSFDPSQAAYSLSDMAQLDHQTQVSTFGWCPCEDGPRPYNDCPTHRATA